MRIEAPEEGRIALLLDRVEQELGDFSYIVSHDIAAGVRHLSQFSQLLVDDFGGEAADSRKEFAEQIRLASERCHMMMEQLLVYSRLQQQPLAIASHDGRHLVENALLQLSAEVR